MPSALMSGRPARAAAEIGTMEFMPPASESKNASSLRSSMRSIMARTLGYSIPFVPFSSDTLGAPTPQMGATVQVSGTSSMSSSSTGPYFFTAAMASKRPIYGSPPPPEPKSDEPSAMSSISSIPIFLTRAPLPCSAPPHAAGRFTHMPLTFRRPRGAPQLKQSRPCERLVAQ